MACLSGRCFPSVQIQADFLLQLLLIQADDRKQLHSTHPQNEMLNC